MTLPPGKGQTGPQEGPKSRVISARLHPAYEKERDALEVFDTLTQQGYSPREILTDALLYVAGRTPEMYDRESRLAETMESIEGKVGALSDLFLGRMEELLVAIKNTDPEGLRQFANHRHEEHGDVELSDDFITNVQRAARKTFRQQQKDQE